MDETIYRFKLGDFECLIVNDGRFTYPHPGDLLVVNAPKDRLDPLLKKYSLGSEYVSPYPSLVVKTGDHVVLVDTGAGDFGPETGKLIGNLVSTGIAPGDIDTVIITHGHPDHIGGTIDPAGRPAFPNARYMMWKQEWEFWTREPDLSALKIPEHLRQVLLECPKKYLPPIESRISLIEEEGEILPGISAIAAPGHTPGHMALSISSGGEQMFDFVDAVLHPIHVEQPDWYPAVDLLGSIRSPAVIASWTWPQRKSARQGFPLPVSGSRTRHAKRFWMGMGAPARLIARRGLGCTGSSPAEPATSDTSWSACCCATGSR